MQVFAPHDEVGDLLLGFLRDLGLSSSGITTEACMLKDSAVDGQPCPSAS